MHVCGCVGYDFSPDDVSSVEGRILTYHRIIESFKFAYAKRTHMGDEDYVDMDDVSYSTIAAHYVTNSCTVYTKIAMHYINNRYT